MRRLKLLIASKIFKEYILNELKKEKGMRSTPLVGIIHGFGAEMSYANLLISTAAGMSTMLFGGSVVLSFVIGLILSTSLIAALAVVGFIRSRVKLSIYR